MERYNDAINMIADERIRQQEEEGYIIEKDDRYQSNELTDAAAAYLLLKTETNLYDSLSYRIKSAENIAWEIWPWRSVEFKPVPDNRIRELVKAGAMIVAEIERLQRLEIKKRK